MSSIQFYLDFWNFFNFAKLLRNQGETEDGEYERERLRWFGRVKRCDQEYVGRQTLEMELHGRRRRGRPMMRCINRDMRAIGTTNDEVHARTGWRRIVSTAAIP